MRNLFLLSVLLLSFSAKAQYKFYRDSSYNQTFNLLSGATQVVPGLVWDDPDFSAPIGFMFHFFNDSSDIIYNSENFSLGSQLSLQPVSASADTIISAIIPLASDLVDKGTGTALSVSPISYKTDGVAPNRIFKMQWKNAGFFEPINAGNTDDSIDFQCWLYEGSDIIESRFGTVNLVSAPLDLWQSFSGPFVAIADTLVIDMTGINARKGYNFSGPILNPILDSFFNLLSSTGALPGMTGNPTSGMVFRFIPKKTISGNVGYETVLAYAEPSFNYFQETHLLEISLYETALASYEIISMNGSIIQRGKATQGKNRVDLSQLPSGVFMVRLKQNNQYTNYKFVN